MAWQLLCQLCCDVILGFKKRKPRCEEEGELSYSEHVIFFFHCKSGMEKDRMPRSVILFRAPMELLTVRSLIWSCSEFAEWAG